MMFVVLSLGKTHFTDSFVVCLFGPPIPNSFLISFPAGMQALCGTFQHQRCSSSRNPRTPRFLFNFFFFRHNVAKAVVRGARLLHATDVNEISEAVTLLETK